LVLPRSSRRGRAPQRHRGLDALDGTDTGSDEPRRFHDPGPTRQLGSDHLDLGSGEWRLSRSLLIRCLIPNPIEPARSQLRVRDC